MALNWLMNKSFLGIIALSLICILTYNLWIIQSDKKCPHLSVGDLQVACSNVKPPVHLGATKEDLKNAIRNELVLARKHILKAKRYARSGVTNFELNEADDIIKRLGESLDLPFKTPEQGSLSAVFQNAVSASPVCPEEYKGAYGGDKSFYRTGWDLVKCNDTEPLSSVVSVLLNLQDYENVDNQITTMLKDLAKFYPTLNVVVATEKPLAQETYSVINNLDLSVKILSVGSETAGKVWNKLVSNAKTPYALIGRDIERFYSDLQLERLIRIAHGLGVEAVGGATRHTKDGFWSAGCRQFEMKNFTLAYIEGYDLSRNECLYCEHLTGPFIVKPQVLHTITFDELLPADVLFEDFFIRMKQTYNKLSMSCPDVMNFVRETDSKKKLKKTWYPLVKKWELNRVHLHTKDLLSFSCAEAGIKCRASEDPLSYAGLAVPICCLEELGKGLEELFRFCDKKGVICLSDSGGVVGSVKMGGILPWEIDADLRYKIAHHSILQNSKSYFKQFGYSVVEGDYKVRPYFDIYVHGWRLELYGEDVVASEDFIKAGWNVTRINTYGYGHPVPFNPGYYVRSRYGHEIFWHVQSWRVHKEKHSFVDYKSGKFLKCPKPGHHSCLDQFAVDGNIQFMGPWL